MAKKKTFRTDKHNDLTLWNGSKRIKFVRNMFATEDASDISFIKKKMETDPHFKIREVKPGEKVEIVDVDVMQQARIEREVLESKVIDAEIKADNAEARIKELEAKLAEKSAPEEKKPEPSKKK